MAIIINGGEVTYYITISPSQLNFYKSTNDLSVQNVAVRTSQSAMEQDMPKYRIHFECYTNQYGFDLFDIQGDRLIEQNTDSVWSGNVGVKIKDLTNIPNGYMVPCTQLLENPSALLEDVRFKELLNTLSENYRFVIIDSPPLGSVADGALIASLCDGAVLVVRAGTTPRTLIKQSLYEIQQSGCKLLGTVLNRADVKGRAYGKYGYGKYGYGYGYGYGYEPKDKKNSSDSAAADKNSTGK